MYGNTDNITALPNEVSAKKLKEMAIEISRLESEVERWKESAQSCNIKVSRMKDKLLLLNHEEILTLSYKKIHHALDKIPDFNLSSTLLTFLMGCLPNGASAEECYKVAKLIPLFSSETNSKVPSALLSEKAAVLKDKLVNAGLLDDEWQPQGLSCTECALLAKCISDQLSISETWQVFGNLWKKKPETLRAAFNRAFDQKKSLDFQDELKDIIIVS